MKLFLLIFVLGLISRCHLDQAPQTYLSKLTSFGKRDMMIISSDMDGSYVTFNDYDCFCHRYRKLKNEDLPNLLSTYDNKLSKITLSYNELSKISSTTFGGDNFTSVKELRLDHNYLETIDPNSFDRLVNLEVLVLGSNRLRVLDSMVFQKLSKLRYLYLGHNNFEEFSKDLFKNLRNLETLDLSGSNVKLYADHFVDLNNLYTLFLNYMGFTELEPHSFKGLEKLNTLYLDNSKLTKLKTDQFSELKSLRSLFINKGQIEFLEDYAFRGMDGIQSIFLNDNRIKEVPEKALDGMCKSKTLFFNGMKFYGDECPPIGHVNLFV